MTVDRTAAPPADGSPPPVAAELPVSGTLPGMPLVRYTFTTAAAGTMSDVVGEGDAAANRESAAVGVGLPRDLRGMRQVHSADVGHVAAPGAPLDACDGLVSNATGLTLYVLAADCVPVLLASGDAIGVVHAGRAGVIHDIAGAAVERLLRADTIADPTPQAVIGPAIGPCCYEVPGDMADQAEQQIPGISAHTTWGTPSLDLPGAVLGQLRAAGVTTAHRVGGCTLCGGPTWFSHRAVAAEGRPEGRHAGMIARLPR